MTIKRNRWEARWLVVASYKKASVEGKKKCERIIEYLRNSKAELPTHPKEAGSGN